MIFISPVTKNQTKTVFSVSIIDNNTNVIVVLLHGHPTEIEGERQPKHLFAGSNPGCGNRSSQSQFANVSKVGLM